MQKRIVVKYIFLVYTIWIVTCPISSLSSHRTISRPVSAMESLAIARAKIVFAGDLNQNCIELAKFSLSFGCNIHTVIAPEIHASFSENSIIHENFENSSAAIMRHRETRSICSILIASLDGEKFQNQHDLGALARFFAYDHATSLTVFEPYDIEWMKSIVKEITSGQINRNSFKKFASLAIKKISSIDLKYANDICDQDKYRNVLLIGSGGREHAIAAALSKSEIVKKVYCAPGNGGTNAILNSKICNVGINPSEQEKLLAFVTKNDISLVFVGPEIPLIEGISDFFMSRGISCFGPTKAASKLEGSKAFSKDFMIRHNIPTARYQKFTDSDEAKKYIYQIDYPIVVKASGLAAGKGVIVPDSVSEAIDAVDDIMVRRAFGNAGDEVVIEERLYGEEISILAFCDGITAVCMPAAQDHKRVFDGDKGLNTGGMGAYAPAPCLTPKLKKQCTDICKKTVAAMAKEGMPFTGVLFAGIMLTSKGPYVIEFNVRMGDPETQVLLPLMETSLYDVAIACTEGRLQDLNITFKSLAAATVVMAAAGYPQAYPKGMEVKGIELCSSINGVTVYHAGTAISETGIIKTNGGRVLSVTGISDTLEGALNKAYKAVKIIHFDNSHYRKDIGYRGLNAKLKIGVLASGNGTALGPILDTMKSNLLKAEIVIIITNKENAPVLTRAFDAGIPSMFVPVNKRDRTSYDEELTQVFIDYGVELILMVGYMRIASDEYRCLNVHPSLLPDFAGGMDLDVHKAVISANKDISGCSIHFVTEVVDGGEVVVQKTVSVESDETPLTLKKKVQALEGHAFIEAIQLFIDGKIGPKAKKARSLSYKDSGVDIEAGSTLIELIKPACKSTMRVGCDAELGGFGGLFDLSQTDYGEGTNTILIGATDGVGTKLKIAQAVSDHSGVGIDLVAMCVNDVIVAGGEPLFFLDYYATGQLIVPEAASIIESIAEGCRQAKCGLIGGETAELPSMYTSGEYDLAGFAVGAARKEDILPKKMDAGDVILGLGSSGIHSNGFSLVRKIIEQEGISYAEVVPFKGDDRTFGQLLLTPTKIYVSSIIPLLRKNAIKGLAHITGGGILENVPRILSDDKSAHIDLSSWKTPPIFTWLQSKGGLSQNEMLRTFNCGIGMVLVISPHMLPIVRDTLKENGACEVWQIGSIENRQNGENHVCLRGELN